MKLKDVPKDDANALEGKTSFIQYAVDDQGNYVQEKSPGFEPQNIALEQAWDEVNENIAEALNQVSKGLKSPIYFFMHREIMELKILAEYMNLPRWKVWLHLNPKRFKSLNDGLLNQYAEVLQIKNVADLVDFKVDKWK